MNTIHHNRLTRHQITIITVFGVRNRSPPSAICRCVVRMTRSENIGFSSVSHKHWCTSEVALAFEGNFIFYQCCFRRVIRRKRFNPFYKETNYDKC